MGERVIQTVIGMDRRPGFIIDAEQYARLERRAKDWAKNASCHRDYENDEHGGIQGFYVCLECGRRSSDLAVAIIHAHDCDAAIILDLERESVG